jgi:hypothetical protein
MAARQSPSREGKLDVLCDWFAVLRACARCVMLNRTALFSSNFGASSAFVTVGGRSCARLTLSDSQSPAVRSADSFRWLLGSVDLRRVESVAI